MSEQHARTEQADQAPDTDEFETTPVHLVLEERYKELASAFSRIGTVLHALVQEAKESHESPVLAVPNILLDPRTGKAFERMGPGLGSYFARQLATLALTNGFFTVAEGWKKARGQDGYVFQTVVPLGRISLRAVRNFLELAKQLARQAESGLRQVTGLTQEGWSFTCSLVPKNEMRRRFKGVKETMEEQARQQVQTQQAQLLSQQVSTPSEFTLDPRVVDETPLDVWLHEKPQQLLDIMQRYETFLSGLISERPRASPGWKRKKDRKRGKFPRLSGKAPREADRLHKEDEQSYQSARSILQILVRNEAVDSIIQGLCFLKIKEVVERWRSTAGELGEFSGAGQWGFSVGVDSSRFSLNSVRDVGEAVLVLVGRLLAGSHEASTPEAEERFSIKITWMTEKGGSQQQHKR